MTTDGPDALDGVRATLATIDDLPVEQRADVFEQLHEVLADELAALEEV